MRVEFASLEELSAGVCGVVGYIEKCSRFHDLMKRLKDNPPTQILNFGFNHVQVLCHMQIFILASKFAHNSSQ